MTTETGGYVCCEDGSNYPAYDPSDPCEWPACETARDGVWACDPNLHKPRRLTPETNEHGNHRVIEYVEEHPPPPVTPLTGTQIRQMAAYQKASLHLDELDRNFPEKLTPYQYKKIKTAYADWRNQMKQLKPIWLAIYAEPPLWRASLLVQDFPLARPLTIDNHPVRRLAKQVRRHGKSDLDVSYISDKIAARRRSLNKK